MRVIVVGFIDDDDISTQKIPANIREDTTQNEQKYDKFREQQNLSVKSYDKSLPIPIPKRKSDIPQFLKPTVELIYRNS